MLKKIFGTTEKRKVVTTKSWTEYDVDMGGMDRQSNVPIGATGVVSINSKSNKVSVQMDVIQDPVFSKKMVLVFNSLEEMLVKFKFVEESTEKVGLQKSSIF